MTTAKNTKLAALPPPDPLQAADPEAYYQNLFDTLGDAYWAASDLASKDQIQGAREAVHTILTAITRAKIAKNTSELIRLGPMVTKTNVALKQLQKDINGIVKKIQVAADVENAIAKVLSLAGKLM
ncbi:MAG: hypothetical protein JWM43_4077 [Acidobacteriaceae bacterium]|nr:hypothetical protein [Acidobacteriaceae bacterium]